MTLRLTSLVTTLAVFASTAYAEDQYQWEISGSFASDVTDTKPDETTANAIGVSGTYHFAPVRLSGHPYEEAAFIERASSVGADLGYFSIDDGSLDASGPGGQLRDRYAAQDVPVAVDAAVSMFSIEDSDNDLTINNVTFDLRVGLDLLVSPRSRPRALEITHDDRVQRFVQRLYARDGCIARFQS